jgi:transposase
MKGASPGGALSGHSRCQCQLQKEALRHMVHAGLDLSRKRLDVQLLGEDGAHLRQLAVSPDLDGLRRLASWTSESYGEPVQAAIESMNGARFIHDQLELLGWDVEIADAQKVKGLAPLACKTDRIDAWVLAELSRRDLVPALWLPDPSIRAERERARWRLHLVRHRTALKNRIHQTLITFGHARPVSDLFGARGRALLDQMVLPEPWHGHVAACLHLIDDLDRQIVACECELKELGADHPYIPLLVTAPGIGWVLAYTIAAEIGDINRFATPVKLAGYSGLCPKVRQSGSRDERGPLTKHGPKYLRWALIEAAQHASRSSAYRRRHQNTKRRLGKQRGNKIANVDVARKLAEAIWYMLTRNQPFAPAGATCVLAA